MKLKVFTLRLDLGRGVFDDAEVEAFLADKQVLDVAEHLLVHEQVPTWCLLVRYRDVERPDPRTSELLRKDWRATLSGEEQARFDALRRWRNERAQREGRPPYVLLTNRQIAELARRRPRTLAEVRSISGLGEARVAAFGEELVALLAPAEVRA